MRGVTDTIVAPFTGPGPAGVTGVRISGMDAWRIASELTGVGDFVHLQGRYVRLSTGDDGVLLPYADRRGYTGEPAAEIFVHGSPVSVRRLLEAAVARGARIAAPGEFTQRAFLNGRLDLSAAESVVDVVAAETDRHFDAAHRALGGGIRARIAALRETALDLLASVEASVDFAEEIGPFDFPTARRSAAEAAEALRQMVHDADASPLVRTGVRIAIVGAPNAGKSSLLNAVLRSERAIVTAIPGTTRDTLEEAVEIGGFRCVVIDTAGIRATDDAVESIGVARAEREARSADIVWSVREPGGSHSGIEGRVATFRIANKSDLAPDNEAGEIPISALHGDIAALIDATARAIAAAAPSEVYAERHVAILREADAIWQDAIADLDAEVPPDLIATHLREFIANLGRITGDTATPDMLDEIFSRFCIGK